MTNRGRNVTVDSDPSDTGVAAPVARQVRTADGKAVLRAAEAATAWLAAQRDAINALNVFPVPDGDTGTNMHLTMRAGVDEGRRAFSSGGGAGAVAAAVAHGALLGARGNSGVILSQVIRGFAGAIADRTAIDGRDLARGLAGARDLAYKAVVRPVEGTMLTVVRVAAERAEASAAKTASLPTVLAAAVAGARDALRTTPELLDILRQAGVVDAGGQGIVRLLEGLERYARGDTSPDVAVLAVPAPTLGEAMGFLDRVDELHGGDAFGYCTNFVVLGEGIDADRARADLAAMGDSAVVVGDDRILKVHLHTLHPGRALEYGLALGTLDQIKIDNMQAQTRALADQRRGEPEPAATAAAAPTPAATAEVVGTITPIAVAAGDGLAAALRSMGAGGIVAGGQTANPSTKELLGAVERAPTPDVILLPNNPNVLLAAAQVPSLAEKRVAVVPSRSVPQGLAALAAFNHRDGLQANAAAMTAALAGVRTVELTRAVRDAAIDGVAVASGQWIGLLDDRLVAAGDDEASVVRQTLAMAGLDEAELVTVFVGDGVAAERAEELRATIAAEHPDLEVEIHRGGQPHYRYVIAVE
jgi:DAK2 domain fusion protein YloV